PASLAGGGMVRWGGGLWKWEGGVVAVRGGGGPWGAEGAGEASKKKHRGKPPPPFAPSSDADWDGWGYDTGNSRFQPNPGLSAAEVSKLTLKWAFGFPHGNSAYAQPTAAGGREFVGADTGFVYPVDARSGGVHWSVPANAGVRTAVSIGPGGGAHRFLAYFGDVKGNVYAVDVDTGSKVWTDRIDRHPVARVTGSPTLVDGRLYVPISSLEES